MLHPSRYGSAAFALLMLVPVGSAAAPLASPRSVEELEPVVVSEPEANGLPLAAAPVDEQRPIIAESELGEQRGGQSLVVANQTLEAIAAGNSIFGDATAGAVNVTDNALSNFNGLGNIMINTGSQVNLQSGMNITINVNP